MVSQLEKAMEMIITVFHSYSGKEGDKLKLTRMELQQLLQGEFGVFLSPTEDTKVVDQILKDLDENQDGEVDFEEFVVLVAAVTVATHEFFVKKK